MDIFATLAAKIGVTAAATVPFVTSSVTLTPEREGGRHTDSIFEPNLWTQHPTERSSILPPSVMTTVVAAIVFAGTSSAPVLRVGTKPAIQSLLRIPLLQNVINDPALDDPEVCHSMIDQLAPPWFFSQLRGMDYDQLYAEFNVGAACQTCLSAKVRLRSEHNFRERKKFERKSNRQADLLKEKDSKIANLKAQLEDHDTSGDVDASTAVATVPFVTSSVTLTPEREGGRHTDSIFEPNLRTQHPTERSSILPPPVMTTVVAAIVVAGTSSAPVLRVASFRRFSEPFLCLVGLSRYYDLDDNVYLTFLTDVGEEMDIFAYIHHAEPIKGEQNDIVKDVGPHDLNEGGSGAEVGDQTKETDRVVQDEEVKIIADEDVQAAVADKPKRTRKKRKAASGASGLLDRSTLAAKIGVTAVATVPFVTSSVTLTPEREGGRHTDSIFEPNLWTQHPTERSSILPPSVMTTVVAAIVFAGTSSAPVLRVAKYATDLGTAIGLSIDKGMQTGLVAGIDHGKAERSLADVAAYDPFVEAKYVFAFLVFRPSAETLEGSRLQPSYEQLFLPIYRKEDSVVIGETSLSDSLEAVHARVLKIKEGVPSTVAAITTLVVANVNSVVPISVTEYGVLDAEPQPEASHSPRKTWTLYRVTLQPVDHVIHCGASCL
nr:hypothetical protein [Tanacetum cinerariifolium]